MRTCPINPKDYINAPFGEFVKDVRKYDPDYGRNGKCKYEFTIKYTEIQRKEIEHTAVVEAYTFEEARQSILKNDTNVIRDDENSEDTDYYYEDFKEESREELDESEE